MKQETKQLISAIEDLTYQVEALQMDVAALNSGEIYGGTLTDAINFLVESINKHNKK